MLAYRFFSVLALVISLVPMAALANVPWQLAKDERLENSKLIVEPPIGQETTREIGESLVRTGIRTLRVTRVWKLTLRENASGRMGFFAMNRQVRANAGASGYMFWHSNNRSPMFCVNPQGIYETKSQEMSGCFVDTDKDGKFDALAFPGYNVDKSLDTPVPYELSVEESSVEIEARDSFFVEVLYQGISRGEMKVSYREYKGGMARPAFTQDVTYELESDGSGVIAFRGLRIKVVRATRENITYIVQQLGASRV